MLAVSSHNERLTALRTILAHEGLDGYLITSADPHQSEDCPDHDRALMWLSGFSGSLGRALVLADQAILFVDGRYQVQAAKQIDCGIWRIAHLHQTPPESWLSVYGSEAIKKVGFDPMLWTVTQAKTIREGLARCGIELVALPDPVSRIWHDRPPHPSGPIRVMPDALAGQSSAEKIHALQQDMTRDQIDLWVESRPDEIAWLLNIRGSDIPMHPVPLSFALIPSEGPICWFIASQKLNNEQLDDTLVRQFEPEALIDTLTDYSGGKRVGIDPNFAPDAMVQTIAQARGDIIMRDDPIMLRKARKTPAELKGYTDAHLSDGTAWVNFCAWLDEEVPSRAVAGNPVTECEAADRIQEFRTREAGFLEPSFKPISAVGSNAAMCHYNPTPGNDAALLPGALYLHDSGGQYMSGTTDATRTLAFAPCPHDIIQPATAVLRGFLSLSMARFPNGTFPHQLDALARQYLWQIGLDYDHGTGHGVGHNLLVHEHPHRFGKQPNAFGLEPGNIMTIEPGYYCDGHFGLRVENQVEVVAEENNSCSLRPLTLIPIDLAPFDLRQLTPREIEWIDAYHGRVRNTLMGKVTSRARRWLIRKTEPIA